MAKDRRRTLLLHPGAILKGDFLAPLGISVYALAKALCLPRTRLNDIVLGRRGVSADTALRLARFFDMTPGFWLNLQQHYDLVMAETEPAYRLAKIGTFRDIQAHA